MYNLAQLPNFEGAGVYAIYLSDSTNSVYENIISSIEPIYVGKAVPEGWRQGRLSKPITKKLKSRLGEHKRSIDAVGLNSKNFVCRFAILENAGLDLISALESALIRKFTPLWNSYIDGFGNHDPGKGRYEQAPSEWDTLHPGRVWATRLTGEVPSLGNIRLKLEEYRKK